MDRQYLTDKHLTMRELTRAEEQVMQVLWKIKKGFVKEILEHFDEPKPAYNTVATVIKVLEKKGYVSHKTFGKTHVYFAVVSKKDYAQHLLKDTFKGLFNGSLNLMVSSFVKNKDVSLRELEELKEMLEKEIENKKQ